MDNDKIALSPTNDGSRVSYSTSSDKKSSSNKINSFCNSQEDSGSTFSELNEKKRNRQRRYVIITLVIVLVGVCIAATIVAVLLTQTNRTGLLPVVAVTEPSNSAIIEPAPSTATPKLTTAATTLNGQDLSIDLHRSLHRSPDLSVDESDAAALVDPFQQKENSEHCPLKYNGKCYRGLIGDGSNLNRTAASNLCKGIGWKLANVYTDEHFYMLEEYLRTLFNNDTHLDSVSDGYIMAWTGMSVTIEDQEIYLSSGENATFSEVPLSECNAHESSRNQYVLIELYETAGELYYLQGFWHCYSAWLGNVALCEQP